MGLYDRLTFEDGLDVDFPDIDGDPYGLTWQTKSISRHHPQLDHYRVTADGRLFRQDCEYETVPETERPLYDVELEGFENPLDEMAGSIQRVHHGWIDVEYHGLFEFHTSIDGDYISLEAKFTDGLLVAIRDNQG
ncbi:hypothetical protein [Haloarchaeobius salinus]|uniref:hypothetical protein n=1 Tax=Haloarchaeobius salinus TaxID=1198298 RepID=UPI00210B42A1|nr:hypothetical protein [Haloarchaeobius salinus]